MPSFEPDQVRAWLAARSLSRGLPAPVADHGGWRVDTGLHDEETRWVFAAQCEGLVELSHVIDRPYRLLKLCAPAPVLMALLSSRWRLEAESWFMALAGGPARVELPDTYRLKCESDGGVTHALVLTSDGVQAASGYAAQTHDAFIYDRIQTAPEHRRRGLARAMMAALGYARTAPVPQLLTATQQGRLLYASMGWQVLSPYVTAGISPETQD